MDENNSSVNNGAIRIRTVAGDIPSDKLGYCHGHEHIMVQDGGPYAAFDKNLCIDDYEKSLQELKDYWAAGGHAIVDAQPVGAGRKCVQLRKLSLESGVSIIASTGFHVRKFYPCDSRIFALSGTQAEELFTAEIEEGMYAGMDPAYDDVKTDIRAGLIKAAVTSPEDFRLYRNLFMGAVETSKKLKVSVMVHTEKTTDIEGFLDFMDGLGMDFGRLIICHMDRTCGDLRLHELVAKSGAFLEYDTVARYKYHDDATECSIIRHMVENGYEDSLLLGLDTTAARHKNYGGTPGLCFIKEQFEDVADGYGIRKELFEKFMIKNPARAYRIG